MTTLLSDSLLVVITVALVLAVLAGRFTPLTAHQASAPARWQEFFQRALALEPERRPASARQFLSELERSLA